MKSLVILTLILTACGSKNEKAVSDQTESLIQSASAVQGGDSKASTASRAVSASKGDEASTKAVSVVLAEAPDSLVPEISEVTEESEIPTDPVIIRVAKSVISTQLCNNNSLQYGRKLDRKIETFDDGSVSITESFLEVSTAGVTHYFYKDVKIDLLTPRVRAGALIPMASQDLSTFGGRAGFSSNFITQLGKPTKVETDINGVTNVALDFVTCVTFGS